MGDDEKIEEIEEKKIEFNFMELKKSPQKTKTETINLNNIGGQ